MSIIIPDDFPHLDDVFSTDLDMEITQSPPQQTSRPQQHQVPDIIDQLQFHEHHDQNTLIIGILAYLDRVERDLSQLKGFIHTGYKRLNDVGDEENLAGEVEK